MRLKLLGGSCAALALTCVALAALAVFVGAILVGQSVTDETFPQATATEIPASLPPTRTLLPPRANGNTEQTIGVTIVAPIQSTPPTTTATAATEHLAASPTATPGASPLGTLDYPLTVTAEARAMSTKVNAYRQSVDATRTAAATRVIPTHAALTLTASADGK